MNKVPFDFPGRVTAEQQAASLHQALAGWSGRSPMWLFGYGSLIWNPEVTYDRRITARVHGYHRRLCLWSRVNRGTLDCPGLVAGLDRGGSCAGIAYRLPAETRTRRARAAVGSRDVHGIVRTALARLPVKCRRRRRSARLGARLRRAPRCSKLRRQTDRARNTRGLRARQLRPLRHQPGLSDQDGELAARARVARSAPRTTRTRHAASSTLPKITRDEHRRLARRIQTRRA